MEHQGVISIVKNGRTFIKIVCGCKGSNVEKLARIIKTDRLDKIQDIYNTALRINFGCKMCLVVMDKDSVIVDKGERIDPLYREKFDDPSFNPRLENGTVDNIVILKAEEIYAKDKK